MKRKLCVLSAFFAVFMYSLALAQGTDSIIQMKVKDSFAEQSPVRLSTLSADVQIMGNIATTTLDMVFVNATDRVLEGEFEFPLGQNESIVGYALDINGKMRQGVVVQKDKARETFEAVVRQGIDPGLVEMTQGNNFKARVYPLPAKGSRRVQITYQSELKTLYEAKSSLAPEEMDFFRHYHYAALAKGKLDDFSFKITVLDTKQPPQLEATSNANTARQFYNFEDLNSGYTASFSRKNYELKEPIDIRLPKTADSGAGSVFTEEKGTDTFFYCYQPIFAEKKAKALPKRLAVYFDISSSAKNRNIAAELKLLFDYIEKLDNPTVTVIPFCNELYAAKQFSGSTLKLSDIEQYIREDGFDGATNLDFNFATLFPCDEALVFTDGIGNWKNPYTDKDAQENFSAQNKAPVVNTINSSATANHFWLEKTAQENGGVYINLTTNEDALSLLTDEPLRLIKAEYDSATFSDVYPLNGTVISGDFSLSGKLNRKSGTITLYFGYGNTVERTESLTVSAITGIQAKNTARQWALKKIDSLSLDYEKNKDEIAELSKRYSIVTKDMSLLVLDSVQDYVRYGITPPEELKAEYDRIVSRQSSASKTESATQGKTIPQAVYNYFEEFRKWWLTDKSEFTKKKKKMPVEGENPLPVPGPVRNEAVQEMVMDSAAVFAEPQVVQRTQSMASPSRAQSSSRSAVPAQTEALAMATAGSAPREEQTKATIALEAWNPNAEYLSILKRTESEKMYAKYLELKEEHGSSPAFFMEVSDYFKQEGLDALSIRILSNIAEMELENSDILRALGNKLVERDLYMLAVPVFEKLVSLRPEVPQFMRDLGMAYFYAGEAQKAVDTLYSVAYKTWDSRFAEVQQIALNDMNAIIAASGKEVNISAIDKRLVQNFDMDVRIVLTWNTDDCDVDLWVTDSDGEKCYYGNKLTANGARISRDFTQGYGPEEFCIRTAPGGSFKIEANYFGNHQQKLLQPVIVQAEVYTNFGRANQRREILTLQLDSVKQTFFIGTVERP